MSVIVILLQSIIPAIAALHNTMLSATIIVTLIVGTPLMSTSQEKIVFGFAGCTVGYPELHHLYTVFIVKHVLWIRRWKLFM